MNSALWAVQIVLAALCIMAGLWKVTGQSRCLKNDAWSFADPHSVHRSWGGFRGLALVFPAVARSWPSIAGWAGAVLAVEAAVFVVYHLYHGAYMPVAAPLVLGFLAAFVAWGRLR